MPPENMQDGTPAASSQQGQQPTSGDSSAVSPQQPGTDGILNPVAKQYADEAAKYRREAREHASHAAELERRLADQTRATQERIIRAELRSQSPAFGIKPELALRLIDQSEITFDDEGEPTNLGALLTKLVKTFPELAGSGAPSGQQSQQTGGQQAQNAQSQPGQGQSSGTPNPGATNPERRQGPVSVTANQYMDKTFQQEFKAKHGMDLETAALRGFVKIV